MIMICKNTECSKEFTPLDGKQKYCSDVCCKRYNYIVFRERAVSKFQDTINAYPPDAVRTCTVCSETKPISEFRRDKTRSSGLTFHCKKCACKASKAWTDSHKDIVRGYDRRRNKSEKRVKQRKIRNQKRYLENKETLKFYWNIRRKSNHIIRQQTGERGEVLRYIGCTRDQWMKHLEAQFKPGMTWENYAEVWEVDHIIPYSSIDRTNRDEVIRLAHYTNTQPLFKSDNRTKYLTHDIKFKKAKISHPEPA